MNRIIALLAPVLLLASGAAAALPRIGAPAPDFTGTDAADKPVRLSTLRGKPVVLEWNNPGCPFVKKHYTSGNMQRTQVAAQKNGATWLTVNSGAPGKQGHMTGAEAIAFERQAGARANAYLLDPQGALGRLYGAKTTPHMFVIDAKGTLVYAGAIDDVPTADPADIKTAKNLVLAALSDVKAGRTVATPTSKPYGCSVKYAE